MMQVAFGSIDTLALCPRYFEVEFRLLCRSFNMVVEIFDQDNLLRRGEGLDPR